LRRRPVEEETCGGGDLWRRRPVEEETCGGGDLWRRRPVEEVVEEDHHLSSRNALTKVNPRDRKFLIKLSLSRSLFLSILPTPHHWHSSN
jgi:hypothetical protein